MYISELKIQGFKSFVKKTSLRFGEGITAVVGPNGCGKTNIVDAIRWVLGEQKSSVLRGGKLEDIIFNGAEGLKPLGMCEVSLTVHNNKGKLPIEYNDVEITRRAYRDGESEYFINRTPCRLKDIHNLFMDTGMGADAYSVIELGMIESILSETRDDRKRMFEEAAGINKYKLERRSAFRKFDVVRQDLERINDIIGEVDSKVHGLALQLKRFKRHAKLMDKLRDKELALAFLRVNYYLEQTQPLESRIKELMHLRESNISRESKKDDELNRLKTIFRSQREEVDQIQARLSEFESEREETTNSILLGSEKKRNSKINTERLKTESANISTKQKQLQETINEHDAEVGKLDPAIEHQLELYKQRKQDFEEAEKTYQEVRQQVENQQAERWQQQQKITENQSLLKRTEQLLEDNRDRVAKLVDHQKQLDRQQSDEATEQKTLEKQKGELVSTLSNLKLSIKQDENQLSRLTAQQQDLSNSQLVDRSRLITLESQIKFYQELVEKNEGYPDGVHYIMEHRQEFPSVLGSLGELIDIDEEYSLILENALGAMAYCLITHDRDSALDILDRLSERAVGHLSIIPLKEMSEIAVATKALPRSQVPVIHALDLVKVKEELKPLVTYLFGNLLLIADMKSALKDQELTGWDLIDRKGVFVSADNILKTPSSNSGVSVIGREQKIAALQQATNQLNSDLHQQSKEMERINQAISEQKKKLASTQSEIDELNNAVLGTEKELIRTHYSRTQTLELLQNNTRQLKEFRTQILQSEEGLKKLAPQVEVKKTELAEMDRNIALTAENLEKDRLQRDSINRSVQELRIETLNLENQRENRLFQKRIAEESITELTDRQQEVKVEIADLKARMIALTDQIAIAEGDLKIINSRIKQQRSVLDLKQKVFDDTYQSIDDLEQRIRAEQRDREALLEELRECEVKKVQYSQQISSIQERIREKYDTDISPDLIVDQSTEQLTIEVDRLQCSIELIGPINLAVQLEYEEEEDRLKLLQEQREDLVSSEENLQETIKKIDRVARKQFLDTFTAIKENFTRLFTMFFEGGEGTLSLSGDPDPLEADVAIFAQPPGKRNQSLRALSAGEKALTAIALLFSIYQVKPSPYCILDEVDAPLDDVNIHKFCRILRKFSDETQFIVVTHNKLTMEATNFLYGITMERKGVSKLVSVKFND